MIDKELSGKVDRFMEDAIDRGFERIEEARGDVKPSEVATYVERYWGLGDQWIEWWSTGDEEYK